jgi:hypothetical protein
MRMDMKEFSDKFCEQDHRTKDTETIWNEFKGLRCLCAPILMLAMTISWSLIPGSI